VHRPGAVNLDISPDVGADVVHDPELSAVAVRGRPVRADLRLRRARARQRRSARARRDPPREPAGRHAARDGAALFERQRLHRPDPPPLLLVAQLRPLLRGRRPRLLQPRPLPRQSTRISFYPSIVNRIVFRLANRFPERYERGGPGCSGVVPLLRARGGASRHARRARRPGALRVRRSSSAAPNATPSSSARHMAGAVPTTLVALARPRARSGTAAARAHASGLARAGPALEPVQPGDPARAGAGRRGALPSASRARRAAWRRPGAACADGGCS
jgi:hypothetical protein